MKPKNTKKAQSAIEYIMIYGWVILLILIVITTLFYSGMLNSLIYPANNIIGFSIIKVERFDFVDEHTLLLTLYNDVDLKLEVQNIKFNGEDLDNIVFPFDILPGERIMINSETGYTFFEGEILKNMPLEITYIVAEGTVIRTETGFLSGKVS